MDKRRFKKHPYLNVEVSDDGMVHRPEKRTERQVVRKEVWTYGHTNSEGYMVIGIDGRTYKVHRLVYETWCGPILDGYTIDHIDRDRTNNVVFNLQLANPKQQCLNSKQHLTRDKRITVSQADDPNEYRRQYNALNREKVRAYQREWYARHKGA